MKLPRIFTNSRYDISSKIILSNESYFAFENPKFNSRVIEKATGVPSSSQNYSIPTWLGRFCLNFMTFMFMYLQHF